MRYYSKSHYDNSGCLECIISIILCVAMFFVLMFGVNSCSALEWNDGECPKCHKDYVLRGAHDGLRYYSCPKCGNEVERFGGR